MSEPNAPPPRRGRKLLVAAIGVATVTYAVACDKTPLTGNLPAPPPPSATATPVAGNLVAVPTPEDAGATTPPGASQAPPPMTGNLPAPPPHGPIEPVGPGSGKDAGAPKTPPKPPTPPKPHKVG